MDFGYARLSKGQLLHENDMYKQVIELNAICNEVIEEEYKLNGDRPRLREILKKMKKGDTLVITSISKIARTLAEVNKIITELINKGIKINILNIGIIDNTAASKLIRNMFFAFTEFEKDILQEKVLEGKFIAIENNYFKSGRKSKYSEEQIESALLLLSCNGGDRSYRQVSKDTGISLSTLYRGQVKKKNEENLKSWGNENEFFNRDNE